MMARAKPASVPLAERDWNWLEEERQGLGQAREHWSVVCSQDNGGLGALLDITYDNCPLCQLHRGDGCDHCSLAMFTGKWCGDQGSRWSACVEELGAAAHHYWKRRPGPACGRMLKTIEDSLTKVEQEMERRGEKG